MILSNLDQGVDWQAAVPHKYFGVSIRDHVIGPAVQNHCAGLQQCPGRPPILPCWAEQHEPGIATFDVHGDGTTTGRSHDNLGLVLVELSLGDSDSLSKVVVRQLGVDDGVAVILQVRRFDATWDRMPAVEDEDGGHWKFVA